MLRICNENAITFSLLLLVICFESVRDSLVVILHE